MKILAIGRNGQLARSLAEVELPPGSSIAFAGRADCDIRDAASVATAIDKAAPDIVVIAAAYTAVDRAEEEEATAFAVNADGPANVGKAAAARGVPVIHVSTDYVYDGTKTTPYVEADVPNPLGVYGRSKLGGEERLADALPRHVILRSAWLHSPFGTNFVKTMLRLAETRETISVVSDQIGNPTYAPHLADAMVAIAMKVLDGSRDDLWGIYHIVSSGETSWFGLAEALFAEAAARGRPTPKLRTITTAEFPTRARRPANSRLDTTKLHETFAISLPRWQDGVAAGIARLVPHSQPREAAAVASAARG
jgi:dTDP-4-dehydrorhamnose reductase